MKHGLQKKKFEERIKKIGEESMDEQTEAETLKSICKDVQLKKQLMEVHFTQLATRFGSRFVRAKETITERRIKKYVFHPSKRIVWIVIGKQREYVVIPTVNFCSCEDFYFQFDEGHLCYHIIAQKLAEITGQFDLFEDDDSFFEILIREWRNVETRTPRK